MSKKKTKTKIYKVTKRKKTKQKRKQNGGSSNILNEDIMNSRNYVLARARARIFKKLVYTNVTNINTFFKFKKFNQTEINNYLTGLTKYMDAIIFGNDVILIKNMCSG